MTITLFDQSIQVQCKHFKSRFSLFQRENSQIFQFLCSKTAVVNERDGDAAQTMAIVKSETDGNGERDKLVQFEKTPDDSSYAQNYFSNVSAIS